MGGKFIMAGVLVRGPIGRVHVVVLEWVADGVSLFGS